MWKPTNVDGLWFHGGNLAQCRHYSKFLALQLAARYGIKLGEGADDDGNSMVEVQRIGEDRVYGIPPPAFAEKTSEQEEIPASVASSM